MCRRSDGARARVRAHGGRWLLAPLLAGLLLVAPARAADDVAAFLEQHGLTELLAVHLEDQLEDATGERRDALLVRLAGIYAQLLETVTDPVRRATVSERGRRLLESAPRDATDELRLALYRATFRSAERIAENHRLRLATDEELDQARRTLGALVPDLDALRTRARQRSEFAERRLGRAAGSDSIVLAERSEESRVLLAQATFLTAWALYYQSWLHDRADNARTAQRHFAWLLDLEGQSPEDVSVDLRATEAVARSILGMALCKGLTSSTSTALAWVALLEHERTYEPLRRQAAAWRLVILLEDQQFEAARLVIADLQTRGETIPMHWWRLVAAHAVAAGPRSPTAAELSRIAVTELAAKGELQQVLDLARRYGVSSLGASGFALRYVNGVIAYRAAREAHGDDDPTSRDDVRALYEEAVAEFRAALRERDAERYPAPRADCTRLTAWCLYFQGELLEARRQFELAAKTVSAEAAPETLWMAIVCLDRLVRADPKNSSLANELAVLTERFIIQHPSSAHAPELILRRAARAETPSTTLVDELLAIPVESAVHDAARRRAAQLLYRLFRAATGAERYARGNRYLLVALPIHVEDAQRLDPDDAASRDPYLVRARRILEVSLDDGIARLVAAESVLEELDALGAQSPAALVSVESELAYRRLKERLLRDDDATARLLADRLYAENPDEVWARLASRVLFKSARRRQNEAGDGSAADDLAAVVVRYGNRILDEFRDTPDGLTKGPALGYAIAVGDAALKQWERQGAAEDGRLALEIYEQLLAARPRTERFLRGTALLSERLDKPEQALTCWRTLASGSEQGSETWYEARFHVISMLARSDPARARAVMDQHRQLNPDYGPEPWGSRLRGLDARLPATGESSDGEGREAPDGR